MNEEKGVVFSSESAVSSILQRNAWIRDSLRSTPFPIMDESECTPVPLSAEEIPCIPKCTYEYLDHTADIQLHSQGDSLKESFEQVAMAMFGYMTTNYDSVEMKYKYEIEASGEDLMSLLYDYLNEFLYLFCAEAEMISRVVKITEFDKEACKIKAVGYGESFDITKHPQGTEVKAITYSNMQIHDDKPTNDVFVILDI